MSLYNILHGRNVNSGRLLEILELDSKYPTGRFRDIYLNKDGSQIILYTRNGGGNREHYPTGKFLHELLCDEEHDEEEEETEGSKDCDCTGCIMTYQIPEHPYYVTDYDDNFDSTYAYVVYSVPDKYKEECTKMATGKEPENVSQKFEKTIKEMEKIPPEDMKKDARFAPVINTLAAIGLHFKNNETPTNTNRGSDIGAAAGPPPIGGVSSAATSVAASDSKRSA